MGAYRDENEKRHLVLQVQLCELEMGKAIYIRKKRIFNKEGSFELGKRVSITTSRNG